MIVPLYGFLKGDTIGRLVLVHDTNTVAEAEIEARPENRSTLQGWIAEWDPATAAALQALAPIFEHAPIPQKFAEIWAGVKASVREHRLAVGLLGSGS